MKILSNPCYYVYLITDISRKELFTGVTSNLQARLLQHEQEARRRLPKNGEAILVYYEQHPDMLQAIGREQEIKSWSRKKKAELVNTTNPDWRPLNEEIYAARDNQYSTPR
jgi:putative endonuclease